VATTSCDHVIDVDDATPVGAAPHGPAELLALAREIERLQPPPPQPRPQRPMIFDPSAAARGTDGPTSRLLRLLVLARFAEHVT
jgi:hypothetical protein